MLIAHYLQLLYMDSYSILTIGNEKKQKTKKQLNQFCADTIILIYTTIEKFGVSNVVFGVIYLFIFCIKMYSIEQKWQQRHL